MLRYSCTDDDTTSELDACSLLEESAAGGVALAFGFGVADDLGAGV
jgi:hypothetical protein